MLHGVDRKDVPRCSSILLAGGMTSPVLLREVMSAKNPRMDK